MNGFLVLALAVFALLFLAWETVGGLWPRSGAAVPVAEVRGPGAPPRAIRYDAPRAIRGTTTRLVEIRHGKADQPRQEYGVYAAEVERPEPLVNVIFLTPGEPQGRLLMERPALIHDIWFPPAENRERLGFDEDTLATWIAYRITDRDTNADGRLDSDDDVGLYVSALDGTGLRRILPKPLRMVSHTTTPDRRGILILALEPPRGRSVPMEQMRQRAFLFDVASGRLTPYTALDDAADRAARRVGR